MNEDELLLQEIYRGDPWRFLASCVLLNQTNRKQVDEMRKEFFSLCPSETMYIAEFYKHDDVRLKRLLMPLGFGNRRRLTLFHLAMDLRKIVMPSMMSADDVLKLYGCGEYASDSWAIFMDDDLNREPEDKELRKYLDRVSA